MEADLTMKKESEKPKSGCLEATLVIVFMCGFYGIFFGPKGILFGLAQFFVIRFAEFFHDVFAPRQKQ